MDKDRESLQFWSSLLYSLADSDPKDGLFPEISSPIMVMSTSMATDVSPKPSNAPGDGDRDEARRFLAGQGKAIAETGDKIIHEVGAIKETKNLGKRPRTNEARNIAEKRDIASTLDCIIDNIRWMKHYVESQSMGPMLPLGMKMDFPAPWFPFSPPNFIMRAAVRCFYPRRN
ncbi:unnamed protein product [Brassica rapa]|uniref:Uncharacterized protein n=1 Tax=Brassica campestris TaxID=3711 RepID=A0A8D9HQX6_BRACM|nr:unnamed protein product [Brassica rapa]